MLEHPLPHPAGWFLVSSSADLAPGVVRPVTLMGRELVLFRTQEGEACVLDAYCPHQGAHLGYGGRVIAGPRIMCPFHGFQFDLQGRCTATGDGCKPPAQANLRAWPVHEVNGLVLVYYHPEGTPPTWKVPEVDLRGWPPMRSYCFRFAGHPQEATENTVDISHFTHVHHFGKATLIRPFAFDGPLLTVGYSTESPVGIPGFASRQLRVEFNVCLYGLGVSYVDLYIPTFRVAMREFICPTPLRGGEMDLRVFCTMRLQTGLDALRRLEESIPIKALCSFFSHGVLAMLKQNIRQDVPIWANKKYVAAPMLTASDGPISRYRRWARQFYSEPTMGVPLSPEH